MGRILQVFPGDDGLVRGGNVKTSSNEPSQRLKLSELIVTPPTIEPMILVGSILEPLIKIVPVFVARLPLHLTNFHSTQEISYAHPNLVFQYYYSDFKLRAEI
ncbi:hypothetical protein TNCV_2720261 [Trichonephila clavipes]|nr:hypothetical protein TNCV_2720261 [Trichonephila clavipes]